MDLGTYAQLVNESTPLKSTLHHHFSILLKSVKRKINKKPKSTNPWTITARVNLPKDAFLKWFVALRDYRVQNFRDITLKKNKKGKITNITISFTRIGVFKFHLAQTLNVSYDKKVFTQTYLKRKWGDGCKGAIVVSDEKPAVMSFNTNTGNLDLSLKYEVTNMYGNVF